MRLKNETQYDWAMARIEELLPFVTDETPQDDPKFIELDVLSGLVEDYERKYYNIENLTVENGAVIEKKKLKDTLKFTIRSPRFSRLGKKKRKSGLSLTK